VIQTNLPLPKIYPITDTAISGIPHAEQVALCAAGGATFVQLREKTLSSGDFYLAAKAAMEFAKTKGVRVIINDRVDVALAVHADGVHLGQRDLPPEAARKLLGDKAVIGLSTHSIEQARQALALPVNYLAIGPIFATGTKKEPDPEVGLEGLRAVKAVIGDIPLVAIGGISFGDIAAVLEAGADSVALISALWRQPEPVAALLSSFLKVPLPSAG
jgi:thiamine-phosphate pyrophosphorylase